MTSLTCKDAGAFQVIDVSTFYERPIRQNETGLSASPVIFIFADGIYAGNSEVIREAGI